MAPDWLRDNPHLAGRINARILEALAEFGVDREKAVNGLIEWLKEWEEDMQDHEWQRLMVRARKALEACEFEEATELAKQVRAFKETVMFEAAAHHGIDF